MLVSLRFCIGSVVLVFASALPAAENAEGESAARKFCVERMRGVQPALANQKEFFERARLFEPKQGTGFSQEWLHNLKHVTAEYYGAEFAAFAWLDGFDAYVARRSAALAAVSKELEMLSFGGLRLMMNVRFAGLRDAISDFVSAEEAALEDARNFSELHRFRRDNLQVLLRELNILGYNLQSLRAPSVEDFLELRALWLDYVQAELAVYGGD